MAIRKAKVSFAIRRLKGFWKSFSRSKRGLLGIGILMFFIIIALAAPLLSSNDPVAYGSVPLGEPAIADRQCLPSWYRLLPGYENLTETLYVIPDKGFTSSSSLETDWNHTTTENTSIAYNQNFGFKENGCLEISFNEKGTVSLTREFSYPFSRPPRRFYGITSYYINKTLDAWLTVSFYFKRNGERFDIDSFSIPPNRPELTLTWRTSTHVDSSSPSVQNRYRKNYDNPEAASVIFTEPGSYIYGIEISYGGEGLTVYLDDSRLILYGDTYGLLGTDNLSRDIFSQLVYGTRISLLVGLLAAFLSVAIGLLVGLVAGYGKGVVDEVLMRFSDMLLVIPTLPLILVLVFVLGRSIWNIILVLSVLGWMGFARTIRSQVLSLKERPFVEAAKSVGAGTPHILWKHILPNVFALVYVSLALSVPSAIVSEASLTWLGLGDVNVCSWGMMLYNFEQAGLMSAGALQYWYWVVFPGIGISLLSLSFILIGYALDEMLNPKLRERR
jgi:peptide/nickel transport system permease protein